MEKRGPVAFLKVCSLCRREKPAEDFYAKNTYCKECQRRRMKAWRKAHPGYDKRTRTRAGKYERYKDTYTAYRKLNP